MRVKALRCGFVRHKERALARAEMGGGEKGGGGSFMTQVHRGSEDVNTGLYSPSGACELSLWKDSAAGGGTKGRWPQPHVRVNNTRTQTRSP